MRVSLAECLTGRTRFNCRTTLVTSRPAETGANSMVQQIHVGERATLPGLEDDNVVEIATDVAYSRLGIVNVMYLGPPDVSDGRWVLVDAGVWGTTNVIVRA